MSRKNDMEKCINKRALYCLKSLEVGREKKQALLKAVPAAVLRQGAHYFAFILRYALMNSSISPSITAEMFPSSYPVRVSFARV